MPQVGATVSERPAICFVVHRGFLECQALLLVASLRWHNPDQFQIWAGVPSFLGGPESGISPTTRETLERMGVRFFVIDNPFKESYLIGNKLGCLKGDFGTPHRLFLDTDILCTGPLKLPRLAAGEIAVKPADRKTYSWSDDDWEAAYQTHTGAAAPTTRVCSSSFQESMYPYYNAGVIQLNTDIPFGDQWLQLSQALDQNPRFTDKRPWLDQLALPLTIRQAGLVVKPLTERHNFPANIQHSIDPEVQLVHYHKAKNVARNPSLLATMKPLLAAHPWLRAVLKADAEWQAVVTVLDAHQQHNVEPGRGALDVLISGIPRSGTSLLSALLSAQKHTVVINEPQGFTKPLKRRAWPWGIHGLFLDMRRDILCQQPVLNKHKDGVMIEDTVTDNRRREQVFPDMPPDFTLVLKNTLAGLVGIDRILRTHPGLKWLVCFRDPVDTLASWQSSFPHLVDARPLQTGVVAAQLPWLSTAEQQSLAAIDDIPEAMHRRALLWRFLGQKIIQHSDQLLLIDYANLTANCQQQLQVINQHLGLSAPLQVSESLHNRSKRDQLSGSDVALIERLCGPTHRQMQRLAAASLQAVKATLQE